MTAHDIITALNLSPHPEGGYYRQTWQDTSADGRPCGTCIYFLLERGKPSHWHRVDAVEIWHFHAGAPIVLSVADTDAGPKTDMRLGPDIAAGERPQGIVPKDAWQAPPQQAIGRWSVAPYHRGFSLTGSRWPNRGLIFLPSQTRLASRLRWA